MTPRFRITLLTLAATCLLTPAALAQDCGQLTDAGFEADDGTALTVWTTSAPVAPAVIGDPANARTDDNYLEYTDGLYVEQGSVRLPLAVSTTFTFHAQVITPGAGQIQLLVDGNPVGSVALSDMSSAAYAQETITFFGSADGGNHTIQIRAVGLGAAVVRVDDVCLTANGAPYEPGGSCDGNELQNPDFESGPVDWTPGPITQDATASHTGEWYAQLDSGSSNLEQTLTPADTAGHYELSFYLQIPSDAATGTLTLLVNGAPYSPVWTEADHGSFSSYSHVSVNIPPNSSHTISFQSTGTLEFRLDDVCLVPTTVAPIDVCPDNEVLDPSFEAGVWGSDWSSSSSTNPITHGPDEAASGDWYARFVDDASQLQQDVTPTIATDPYELTFELQIPSNVGTGELSLYVNGFQFGPSWTEADQSDFASYTSVTFVVPPRATHSLEFRSTGDLAFYVDDICFAPTTTTPVDVCPSNEMLDPSFEEGPWGISWTSGSAINPITYDPDQALSGDWFARFQGTASHIEQSFVPSQATRPYELRFFLHMPSTTGTGTLDIMVDGASVAQWSDSDQTAFANYTEATATVPLGASHTIAFQSTGDFEFRVDDICLIPAFPVGDDGCPSGAVTLIFEGDFEPDDCSDGVAAAQVKAVWDGDLDDIIVTCDGSNEGVAGSEGYAHFQTGSPGGELSQGGITLDDDIVGLYINFYVRMTQAVASGETLKLFLDNTVSGDSVQLWPSEDLDGDDLTDYYNDTFGGANLDTYVETAVSINVPNEDPEDYTLRFEREGSAEFYLDGVCLFSGGSVCISGGTPTLEVISSNEFADFDTDIIYPDDYVGRATTATIILRYPAGTIGVCVGLGGDFDLITQCGETIDLNERIVSINPGAGIIEFEVDIDTVAGGLTDPIDGETTVVADDPLTDTFIIDTIPPVIAPIDISLLAGTPTLDELLDTTDLPGLIGSDFIVSTTDNLTGQTANGALPDVNNPLPPNNFVYTPWDDIFTPDNRILTYATRAGRPAKVFFNDNENITPPADTDPELQVTLQCAFYDPPLVDPNDADELLLVSGFNEVPENYAFGPNIDPSPLVDAVPTVDDTDTAGGYIENFVTAVWPDVSYEAPLALTAANSVHINVLCNFTARDRAGNVRAPQEALVDGLELWWLEQAQSRLTPDWSNIQPTPDEVYFDFAMDRTYEPNPLGAPLPIFNVIVEQAFGVADTVPLDTDFTLIDALGWTPARRLNSAYFQDLLAANPGYASSWIRVGLLGADEAGNFEDTPSYQAFFIQGGESAIDTTIQPRFWHNRLNPLNGAYDSQFEFDFGSATIIPFPTDPTVHRVEAAFNLVANVPANAVGVVRFTFELEEAGAGIIRSGTPVNIGRTLRIVYPLESPGFVFGDPGQVKEYIFRAAAMLVDPADPDVILFQDPTPAAVRFRVVPGSVQQYLEDMTDPQDQPIKEVQRLE